MGRIFLVARHPHLRDAMTLLIQTQSQHALRVVGSVSWDAETLAALAAAQPDVLVLTVGLDAGDELRLVAAMRAQAPDCRLLIVDTLGDASDWQTGGWGQADALLRTEQLAQELVPAIRRLLAQSGAAGAASGAAPTSPCSPE